MRSGFICTGLAALALTGFAGWATPRAVSQSDETLPWLDDLEEARVLAREKGKPLLIVFR